MPRVSPLRSIGTRLMAVTALLVSTILAVVVWQWAASERSLLHDQKRAEARSLAIALANAMINELDDENWSQIRVNCRRVMDDNHDLVYVMVHDRRRHDRVIAASPRELGDHFVPDIVAAKVTEAAVTTTSTFTTDATLLRALRGVPQARGGDPVIEVATPIQLVNGERIGTLRVGVSLVGVDGAVAAAARTAILIGGLALLLGLAGAYLASRRLASPIRGLQADAARIAAGDLGHRAEVGRRDEIGALGHSFNDMTAALEGSFGRLNRTLASFERFVPRKFLAVIAPAGIENIEVGTGAERTISVLFADLRGYTKMSESLSPQQVFAALNEYLGRMGDAIDRAGGFVDKYIGDAIMALFDDEHTDGVLAAIVEMRAALVQLNRERTDRGEEPLAVGIGAHSGDVVMGTIGFASKIESTVVGDAVNVASRVETLTKDHGVPVLVTDAIVRRLRDPVRFRLRRVAEGVTIRGRTIPVDLYTLVDEDGGGGPR